VNEPTTYHFGPRDKRGVAFGLDPAQAAVLGLGLAMSLLLVLAAHLVLPGLGALALAAGVAFTPMKGRPAHAWAGPIAAHLLGEHKATAPVSIHRLRLGPARRSAPSDDQTERDDERAGWQLPGLKALRIEQARDLPGDVAIARVGRGGPMSFTLKVTTPHFALADAEDQNRMVSAWGALLQACATARLERVQVTERVAPESGLAQVSWVLRRKRDLDLSTLMSYAEQVGEARALSVRHDLYVTAFTGGRGHDATSAASACARLTEAMAQAGFEANPLSAQALVRLVGDMLEPRRRDLPFTRQGSAARASAPGAWERSWRHVAAGGACHACYEATELPRIPVGADWAWALVEAPGTSTWRTSALHVELSPASKGLRRAQRAVLANEADDALRERHSFRVGAKQVAQTQAALEREAELAAGHADARFVLLVSVGARSEEDLERACAQMETQAAQCQVELARLYGQQPEGLVATLPLGLLRLKGGWG